MLGATLVGAGSLARADSGDDAARLYPETCRSAGVSSPSGHSAAHMADLQDHQKHSMEGMMRMDRDMMQGMMQADADVAFVSGMIAHHQGAIAMSETELAYGDDAWARELARKVIDAQTQEILEMKEWLERNAN
jgi:uncharacterized protein (DUF305 family)